MPMHVYECTACLHKFEELQGLNDKPLVKCPKCNKKKLEKLFSGNVGFVFKGTGFYATDYKATSEIKEASEANKRIDEIKK